MSAATADPRWTIYHRIGLVAIILAVALFGLLIPRQWILLTWILNLVALVLFTMLISHGVTGRFWWGWLVNEQYRMSLSRLQMFLWTAVVLSAFLTAALGNLALGEADKALAIAIPAEVWLAMGISTTSLVGSALILGEKKKKKTNMQEAVWTLESYGLLEEHADEATIARTVEARTTGQLVRNQKPQDARLYDLVSGEEVGNFNVLDLSRLQNLFFSLILIGAYAAAIGVMFSSAAMRSLPINEFPQLDASVLALLGISHGGYLVGKAIDKEPGG